MRIILALYEPKPAFITVTPPGLYRKRLIEVVLMSLLLVGLPDNRLNSFGRRQRPDDQCFEEGELRSGQLEQRSYSRH
jgi:hypothetical protein